MRRHRSDYRVLRESKWESQTSTTPSNAQYNEVSAVSAVVVKKEVCINSAGRDFIKTGVGWGGWVLEFSLGL